MNKLKADLHESIHLFITHLLESQGKEDPKYFSTAVMLQCMTQDDET